MPLFLQKKIFLIKRFLKLFYLQFNEEDGYCSFGHRMLSLKRVTNFSSLILISSVYNFSKSLASIPKKNVAFVAVLVDSQSGAPAQCEIVKQRLRSLKEDKKVPIYTFAGDHATSAGFYILSCGKIFDQGNLLWMELCQECYENNKILVRSPLRKYFTNLILFILLIIGDKVFADGSSVIGGVGAMYTHFNMGKAAKNFDYYVDKYQASKHITVYIFRDTFFIFLNFGIGSP